jgi:hypothetical protein
MIQLIEYVKKNGFVKGYRKHERTYGKTTKEVGK